MIDIACIDPNDPSKDKKCNFCPENAFYAVYSEGNKTYYCTDCFIALNPVKTNDTKSKTKQ